MIRIALTAIFTASIMLNLFAYAPQCLHRSSVEESPGVEIARDDTTAKGMKQLLDDLTVKK